MRPAAVSTAAACYCYRFHRRPVFDRRSTRDVVEATGSDVIVGVSRGRQRDHVLPVRVQVYNEALLGCGRRYCRQ